MRRVVLALLAGIAVSNPAVGQHRPEGAIDWSPDGSWYPNVRTHPELRMPTQAEAHNAYARYVACGGDPMRLGLANPHLPDRLQLFACRPGYFDRHRGETWAIPGWVTCHVFFSTKASIRPSSKATLNWRWTGRRFDLEGTPAATVATVMRPSASRSLKP
jgi:hypothetical protein